MFVVFADHARTLVDRPVIQLPGELVFDDAALFLDHENFIEPFGKLVRHHRFQRPAHADLEQADSDLRREFSSIPRSSSACKVSR